MTEDEKTLYALGQVAQEFEKEYTKNGMVPTEKFADVEECVAIAKELAEANDGEVFINYRMTRFSVKIKAITIDIKPWNMPKFKTLVNKSDLMDMWVTFEKNGEERVNINFMLNDVLKPAPAE